MTYPNTAFGGQSSPSVAPGFTGVQIAAPIMISAQNALIVSGIYQLLEEEAQRIDERLHRALVLVVTSGSRYRLTRPFASTVLLEDDDERFAWGRRGYFNIDVFAGEEMRSGTVFIGMSLGEFLSNKLEVSIR